MIRVLFFNLDLHVSFFNLFHKHIMISLKGYFYPQHNNPCLFAGKKKGRRLLFSQNFSENLESINISGKSLSSAKHEKKTIFRNPKPSVELNFSKLKQLLDSAKREVKWKKKNIVHPHNILEGESNPESSYKSQAEPLI
jgi:hypothetical protein